MAKNLDNEHPDFIATKDARTRSRILYGGNRAFKLADPNGQTYLLKGTNERDEDYQLRLKRAVMDDYVEKVVSARQALLFRKEHARVLPTQIEVYAGDVDMDGSPADVFFQEIAREAQIDGICWVLVDMPKAPEGGYRNRLEETQANHRPYFRRVAGTDVIDWQEDESGELVWAVVKETYQQPRTEPGTSLKTVPRWRILYRDRYEVWESRSGGAGGQTGLSLVETGPNPTGHVNLVPFFGFRYTNYSGWPVCVSVLDHIILILNKQSELDRAERRKTEPLPYFVSPEKPVLIDATKGLWIDSSGAQGQQIMVGLLEADASGLEHNRNSIVAIRDTIFSVTLAQAKRDTAQVQSADSQREDRHSFTSSLMSVSRSYEGAEINCWKLWAKWSGVKWGEQHDVEYSREFDEQEMDAQMVSTLNTLADSDRLTDRTFLDLLQRAGLLPKSIDIEAELKELEQQKIKSANTLREQLMAQRGQREPGEAAA